MIEPISLIREVSEHLVDQECGYEFTSWTQKELEKYLHLSVGILALVNPKLFVNTVEIEVVDGMADLPDPCAELSEVIGWRLPNGEIKNIRKTSYDAARDINRPVCKGGNSLPTYQHDADDPKMLRFDWTPEPGTKLIVRCFASPEQSLGQGLDIPAMYKPILFEMMLYYAYSRDVESTAFKARAAEHFNTAKLLLKLSRDVDNARLAYLEDIRG